MDLWPLSGTRVLRLLDAVSFDCFLAYAYKVLLARDPDESGSTHYRRLIVAGRSRQSIVADLLKSREFQDAYGVKQRNTLPVEDFVNKIYLETLGRWPDEDGRQTYIRIASRWRGRTKVERNILSSGEAMASGGGRLGRIHLLETYAGQAHLLSLPIVGRWLKRSNELLARLAGLEVMLADRPLSGTAPFAGARLPFHSIPDVSPPPNSILETVAHVRSATREAPVPAPAVALSTAPAAASPPKRGGRIARVEAIDPETAKSLEKDGWVFRVAVRDARRREAAGK
jgi:hypothetical protein